MKDNQNKKIFGSLAFALLVVILISIFYLFASTMGEGTVGFIFAFVAGITMIVLPCTLPLAFIIVPLSMGKGYKKGFGIALLFSLGIAITLSLYGIFIALAGNFLGLDEAISKASIFSRILFMIGGAAALLFGLSELKLIKFEIPSFLGTPKFIEKRKDYSKAFFLGLFLGNAGVGCPNPLFYILMGNIAVKGSVLLGGGLGFIHGLGRVTPLILLSILGILGVNATSSILKHQEKIKKGIGWFLVILGAIIFIMGGAHEWYEETVVHQGWNSIVAYTGLPSELMGEGHEHEGVKDFIPEIFAPWILAGLILIPIVWRYLKNRKGGENGEGSGMRHGN